MNTIFILLLVHLAITNCQDVKTIILNGLVATGKEGIEPFLGHVLIGKNGKIVKVVRETGSDANDLKQKYDNVEFIDAKDKVVIPGGVDTGVRFDFLEGVHNIESSDNFFTGSIAAVCGGTTTVVDNIVANLNERETFTEALKYKLEDAEQTSVVDYSFDMKINYVNHLNMYSENIIKKIIYKYGINTFKLDTYTKKPKLTKEEITQVFQILKKYGGLAIINCEDEEIIDANIAECSEEDKLNPKFYARTHTPQSEREAINEIIRTAKEIGLSQGVHISHISTELATHLIKEAKRQGFIATTEVTPHHLILTDEVYEDKNGIDYITSPPLRTKNDIENLWKGLIDGTIDYVVSDHCPFTKEQKRGKRTKPDYRLFYNNDLTMNKTYDTTYEKWTKKIPAFNEVPQGVGGVETRMILMYHYGVVEKRISLSKFVEITSTNAAKRYGLYPRKGLLERGSDADIVIIDPNEETKIKAEKLNQNTNFSPFEDFTLSGKIKTVFIRGTKLFDNYQLQPAVLTHKGNMLRRMRYFLGQI